MVEPSLCKHARNFLFGHVNAVLFKQGCYLAHVKRVRAVLVESFEHFFDVFLSLNLCSSLSVVLVSSWLISLRKPVFVFTSLQMVSILVSRLKDFLSTEPAFFSTASC